MTVHAVEGSPRLQARVAGVCYLITIVAGVFAELFVRGAVLVPDDAAATAANITSHALLYRLGLGADLVMLIAYTAVTVLLYVLLEPVSRVLSLLAAFFSLIGIATLAVNSLTHVAPMLLLGGAPDLKAFDAKQLQALALFALKLHGRGYNIAGVFFGCYCVLIGWLAFRSGFFPRIVGVLMAAGGVSYLLSSFRLVPDISVIGATGEVALTVFLIWKGVNDA